LDDPTSATPVFVNSGVVFGDYSLTVTLTNIATGCSNTCGTTVSITDCIVDCGTAFGVALTEGGEVDTTISNCFRNDGFSRWGWNNYIDTFGTYTLALYQGAGKCDLSKGTYVGTVTITYTQIGGSDEGTVDVVYDMDPQYGLDEVHLYIDCPPYPTKNGKETVAPGQYTFVAGNLSHADGWNTDEAEITATGGFYVIAHAVACGENIPDGSYIPESPVNHGSFTGSQDPNCEVIVDELRAADFTAYPNPFTNEVNVKYSYDYNTKVTVEVFDIKGTLVRSSVDNNYVKGSVGRTTIDLSKADNQMYFVRLTTDKGTQVKKIVSDGTNKQ
jgi:hypothetical protein